MDHEQKNFHLFCMGGRDENRRLLSSVSQMSTTDMKWRSPPEMFTETYNFRATVIGKKIYVCGGFSLRKLYRKLKQLDVFDCETNGWKKLKSMKNALSDFGMTNLDELIFVSGGFYDKDGEDEELSTVSQYSPQTNTWIDVKPMNQARSGHELVTLNGDIYAIGGGRTNTVERYNSSTDEWIFVASTNHSHFHFGAVIHQGKIYILSHKGFEMFDPQLNIWQELPKLNVGLATQLVSINDKLWAVGGGHENDERRASESVFEFDTSNNLWHKLPDMNVARMFHRAVVVNYSE